MFRISRRLWCDASQRRCGEAPSIIQLPARSLWSNQHPIDPKYIQSSTFKSMLVKLREARTYYKYPSMSAPQIGWNVRVFLLSTGTVWVNPELVSTSDVDTNDPDHIRTCWAWEPCASCCSLMHYIERPFGCRLRGLNENGEFMERDYEKLLARLVLHEMDHLDGVLFTRRVPDGNHIVPADGFYCMSDWPNDFPSLEARSTYLYNMFVPPAKMIPDVVPDANLVGRRFEDGIFPGSDAEVSMDTAAKERRELTDLYRSAQEAEKKKNEEPLLDDEEEEA